MALRFTKMHGLGNDFVVLDARAAPIELEAAQIRALADRHTGVGCDQLLLIEPPRETGSTAAYAIRNADGSFAGQCGNGVRCIAAWLQRAGALVAGSAARLDGPSGSVGVRLLGNGMVAVEMGEPDFDPARVPFDATGASDPYPLEIDGEIVSITAVSMGNPHAVMRVDAINAPNLTRLGPAITAHPRFPEGTNAGFAEVLDGRRIRLRVHERGAGWTLACGSGACAAVAALRRRGLVGETVQVELPGGALEIHWQGRGHPLWMTGPAAFSFDGEWLGGGKSA